MLERCVSPEPSNCNNKNCYSGVHLGHCDTPVMVHWSSHGVLYHTSTACRHYRTTMLTRSLRWSEIDGATCQSCYTEPPQVERYKKKAAIIGEQARLLLDVKARRTGKVGAAALEEVTRALGVLDRLRGVPSALEESLVAARALGSKLQEAAQEDWAVPEVVPKTLRTAAVWLMGRGSRPHVPEDETALGYWPVGELDGQWDKWSRSQRDAQTYKPQYSRFGEMFTGANAALDELVLAWDKILAEKLEDPGPQWYLVMSDERYYRNVKDPVAHGLAGNEVCLLPKNVLFGEEGRLMVVPKMIISYLAQRGVFAADIKEAHKVEVNVVETALALWNKDDMTNLRQVFEMAEALED